MGFNRSNNKLLLPKSSRFNLPIFLYKSVSFISTLDTDFVAYSKIELKSLLSWFFFIFSIFVSFFYKNLLVTPKLPSNSISPLCQNWKRSLLLSLIPFIVSLNSFHSRSHSKHLRAVVSFLFLEHDILATTKEFWKWFPLTITKFLWICLSLTPHFFHVLIIILIEDFAYHPI